MVLAEHENYFYPDFWVRVKHKPTDDINIAPVSPRIHPLAMPSFYKCQFLSGAGERQPAKYDLSLLFLTREVLRIPFFARLFLANKSSARGRGT